MISQQCCNIRQQILALLMYVMPYHTTHSVSFLFLTGLNIFSQGPWKEIQDRLKSNNTDVTYIHLFKELQRTALSSKACGTVVNYTSSLNRWVKFASDHKLVVFPVSIVDVALFLTI